MVGYLGQPFQSRCLWVISHMNWRVWCQSWSSQVLVGTDILRSPVTGIRYSHCPHAEGSQWWLMPVALLMKRASNRWVLCSLPWCEKVKLLLLLKISFLKCKKIGTALGRILSHDFLLFSTKTSAGPSAQQSISGFSSFIFSLSLSQPEHCCSSLLADAFFDFRILLCYCCLGVGSVTCPWYPKDLACRSLYCVSLSDWVLKKAMVWRNTCVSLDCGPIFDCK